MPNNWMDLLSNLVPSLGEMGVKTLADKLEGLSAEASEPWKKTVLALTANAVESAGVDGIKMAWQAIEDLVNDKAPKLDWADLEVASDVLAQLQNAEADRKSEARDFFAKISTELGAILGGLIKGLIGSV
jgi:hypothetical protein